MSELTTLHIGGNPLATVYCYTSEAICAVVSLLDENNIPLLIVGGGSNLVVADGDLDFVAVVLANSEIDIDTDTGVLTAGAGTPWDEVVATSVALGLGGIECLSGIPGSAGATPVQNVGAYGAEISDVLSRVELFDRSTHKREWVSPERLELAYRYSNLKFTGRAVVLAIELQLSLDGLSAPLRFGELARTLGASEETAPEQLRFPVAQVRDAVLGLRHGKGMVYDEADHDTWSAGSFFTNPIVPSEDVAEIREKVAALRGADEATKMPNFPAGEGKTKLSAAWLIDRAGFNKGYPGEGPATLSTKHTLALTNRGTAAAADIVELARVVRDQVKETFGVTLVPEPVWIDLEF